MKKWLIRASKGGSPVSVEGRTPYDALCRFASKTYDAEWYVNEDLCVVNPISGWSIQYIVEAL